MQQYLSNKLITTTVTHAHINVTQIITLQSLFNNNRLCVHRCSVSVYPPELDRCTGKATCGPGRAKNFIKENGPNRS